MNKNEHIIKRALPFAAIAGMLCAVIAALFLVSPPLTVDTEEVTTLKEFVCDGKLVTLPNKIDAAANQALTLRTKLPAVKYGDVICVWTNQQNLDIAVEGKPLYTYRMNEGGFFGKMDGSFWHFVRLSPYMTGRELVLTFASRLPSFGGQIYEVELGSKDVVLLKIMKDVFPSFVVSVIIFFVGILMVLLSWVFRQKSKFDASLLRFGLFTIVCSLWLICETRFLEIYMENFYFVTMLSCFCVLLTPVTFSKYSETMAQSKRLRQFFRNSANVFAAISAVILLLQWLNIMEMVESLTLYNALIIAFTFPCAYVNLKNHWMMRTKTTLVVLIIYMVLAASVIVETAVFLGGINHAFLGRFLRVGILCYVSSLFTLYIFEAIQREKTAQKLKDELTQNRLSLMVSQMKPHFLFNTLNAISGFCLTDPIKAEEAITTFSEYLRANIKIFETADNISFSEELEHIKNYTAIEQMRFGEKINVEYDIQFENFTIPALSVQPIVENAIKHGIGKKTKGGTVWIRTEKTADSIIITIEDNGAGFDVSSIDNKERSFGLQYVKNRLSNLIEAHISIESTPGIGTRAVITIPEVIGE